MNSEFVMDHHHESSEYDNSYLMGPENDSGFDEKHQSRDPKNDEWLSDGSEDWQLWLRDRTVKLGHLLVTVGLYRRLRMCGVSIELKEVLGYLKCPIQRQSQDTGLTDLNDDRWGILQYINKWLPRDDSEDLQVREYINGMSLSQI